MQLCTYNEVGLHYFNKYSIPQNSEAIQAQNIMRKNISFNQKRMRNYGFSTNIVLVNP